MTTIAHIEPERVVVGVDTHQDGHVAVGTGCYGAGLSRFLTREGHLVIEVLRPNRQTRRRRGKSDPLDAEAAARAVLSGEASGRPKGGDGLVEAIRTLRVARATAMKARTQTSNALRAMVVTAPEELRSARLDLPSKRPQALRRPRDLRHPQIHHRERTAHRRLTINRSVGAVLLIRPRAGRVQPVMGAGRGGLRPPGVSGHPAALCLAAELGPVLVFESEVAGCWRSATAARRAGRGRAPGGRGGRSWRGRTGGAAQSAPRWGTPTTRRWG